MKNLYEILQCTIDSSDEEIRKKYQQLILEYHPDKCSNENDRNKFIEIDKAWKILRDKESREVYNAQLKMDSVNKPLLYGTYKLNELLKSDNGYFYCKCRCGGSYCVDENDLDDVMDKCFVECDECSLAICISIGNKSLVWTVFAGGSFVSLGNMCLKYGKKFVLNCGCSFIMQCSNV